MRLSHACLPSADDVSLRLQLTINALLSALQSPDTPTALQVLPNRIQVLPNITITSTSHDAAAPHSIAAHYAAPHSSCKSRRPPSCLCIILSCKHLQQQEAANKQQQDPMLSQSLPTVAVIIQCSG
jgi:hypothetical protein